MWLEFWNWLVAAAEGEPPRHSPTQPLLTDDWCDDAQEDCRPEEGDVEDQTINRAEAPEDWQI